MAVTELHAFAIIAETHMDQRRRADGYQRKRLLNTRSRFESEVCCEAHPRVDRVIALKLSSRNAFNSDRILTKMCFWGLWGLAMVEHIFNHGFPESDWQAAKQQAIQILKDRASRNANPTISYSELTREIKSLQLDPHGTHLTHLLDEISREEHEAGHGMLTVLVVQKETGSPGPGFFKLAKSLGYKFKDDLVFLTEEHRRVTERYKKQ